MQSRIRITGWASSESFRDYLAVADLAVQLRTLSRGETSAAVLDCMNYGLPTIVNANGSMADLPAEGVYRLADDFETADLSAALDDLHSNPQTRDALGARARGIVEALHSPAGCARLYHQAIDDFAAQARQSEQRLRDALDTLPGTPSEASLLALAERHARVEAVREQAAQLRHGLDWLPVRVLVASFALVGNFSAASRVLLHELLNWDIPACRLLAEAGPLAADLPASSSHDAVARLDILAALLVRSRVLWYAAVALWVILL